MLGEINNSTYIVDPLDKEASLAFTNHHDRKMAYAWVNKALFVLLAGVAIWVVIIVHGALAPSPELSGQQRGDDAQLAAFGVVMFGALEASLIGAAIAGNTSLLRYVTKRRFTSALQNHRITRLHVQCLKDIEEFLKQNGTLQFFQNGRYTLTSEDVRLLAEANHDYEQDIVDAEYRDNDIATLLSPFLNRVKSTQRDQQAEQRSRRAIVGELSAE